MSNLPTVVILAGGENSRFFPLNANTHKGSLTLLGKPLVVRTLENLKANGFEDIIMVVSPKDYDGNGLSGFLASEIAHQKITYVLQSEANGMGDAVLLAKKYLTDSFAVIFPYQITAGDELRHLMEQAGAGGATAVTYTDTPWLYGVVAIEGKRITSIVEKPEPGEEPSNLKVRGLHYFTHEFLAFLEETPTSQYNFEKAMDKYVQALEVNAVEQSDPLPTLKFPWNLFDFQKLLFTTMPQYVSPYAHVAETAVLDTTNGPIYIENGATVGHCSKIVGPCFIGKDVHIGDFSLIRSSSFEEGSSVGVHSDVTRSIIMEKSSMHNGFLGDSILGRRVKIGAGLITSNRRTDRKNIEVKVKDTKIDTGSSYMGTVIGDDAKIGIRVNIMPGKFIGCRAIVYPTVTVWEDVPHDATVKITHDIEITKSKTN